MKLVVYGLIVTLLVLPTLAVWAYFSAGNVSVSESATEEVILRLWQK